MSASVQIRSAKHLNQPSEPSSLYINALEKSGAVREADEEEDDGWGTPTSVRVKQLVDAGLQVMTSSCGGPRATGESLDAGRSQWC